MVLCFQYCQSGCKSQMHKVNCSFPCHCCYEYDHCGMLIRIFLIFRILCLKGACGFTRPAKFPRRRQSKQWKTSTGKFMQWTEFLMSNSLSIILFQDFQVNYTTIHISPLVCNYILQPFNIAALNLLWYSNTCLRVHEQLFTYQALPWKCSCSWLYFLLLFVH